MATKRPPAGGLSTSDIEEIRRNLANDRKPKVMFTEAAGQIAGQTGQVVQLTDPDKSDEWLVVRFGRDELPFSPADLSIPPRGRPAKTAPPTKPTTPAKADSAQQAGAPAKHAEPAKAEPPPVPAPRAAAAPAGTTTSDAKKDAPTDAAKDAAKPAKRATKTARAAKPKAPASMTVTLAYEAGEWTVAAHQGSKTLAKPYLVRPSEALKMVAMLDVPGVHDAVEQIVTAELTEAQRRADALRSELAEVEARLADLQDAG